MTVAIGTSGGSAPRSQFRSSAAERGGVSRPSVKRVDHRLHAGLVQDLRQRDRVLLMRVHAAGRHQAEQVAGAARRLQLRDQVGERRRAGEAAVLGGLADARQFLHHHAAGADVQVADLGVAHLAVRQADVAARRCAGRRAGSSATAGRSSACAPDGRRCRRIPRASRSRRGSPASPAVSPAPWIGSYRRSGTG